MNPIGNDQVEWRILAFASLLRRLGMAVGTGQSLDAVRALGLVDLSSESQVYAALRAIFLDSHVNEPLFAAAFRSFWLGMRAPKPFPMELVDNLRKERPADSARPQEGNATRTGSTRSTNLTLVGIESEDEQAGAPEESEALAYSAAEALRQKDFGELDERELERMRRLLRTLTFEPLKRRVRRTERSPEGSLLDLRQVARRNLRHGGEVIVLPRRRHKIRNRPLVLLCDVSGSMDRYTRLLLQFLHATVQRLEGVEVFVFGTRLTRITHQLRRRDPDRALDDVSRDVLDFSGGTRIGAAMAMFNRRWARRVLPGGAVVMIICDGWDRGDPALLAAEMAHLHRTCHLLVWLNPLLSTAGYRPLTRGMAAALPHLDLFLPAGNLASLEGLSAALQSALTPEPRSHRERSMTYA